jgi:N-glycosylase/DNA lyase
MLPDFLLEKYTELKADILQRLQDFDNVSPAHYFYELCYCICTPQSKAENALIVQNKLEEIDFLNKAIDPTPILFDKSNYIRFHNQKAKRLLLLKEQYDEIYEMLHSNITPEEKRLWLRKNVNGFGMKESAHFLRNIGYRNLAILDRHILKHLHYCGLFDEIPKISGDNHYLEIEDIFLDFADRVKIPLDELDLLFWSYETGKIIK